jgi:cytochrome b pre-mRNA-processing protein 3
MVFSLFRRSGPPPSVERVYGDIVAAARRPVLYQRMGVPDTVMGRFEVLGLHMALVLLRLRQLPSPADQLAQELVDRFFADLDSALRQIGIGDVSVPKKIKKLAQAFYGRAQAAADALEQALARNVLEKSDQPLLATALAQEARRLHRVLANDSFETLAGGDAFAKMEAAP